MQVIQGTNRQIIPFSQTIATIGNFDGLHLGHQELIKKVVQEAKVQNLKSVVLTFDPHPVKVLFPDRGLRTIFGVKEKGLRIEKLGIDFLVVEPFSRELSELEPQAFFEKIIVNQLRVKKLFVGHDFNFGKNRAGNHEILKRLCDQHQIQMEIVGAVKLHGQVVSSSLIRQMIDAGQMKEASEFLGTPFFLTGVVEKGAGRGRKIGFPTANLFTKSELFPRKGVYVTQTDLRGQSFKSVTNVGQNPTFVQAPHQTLHIETHILGFNEDIYGETIKVSFLERLRDEMKFQSVDELKKQIQRDIEKASRG